MKKLQISLNIVRSNDPKMKNDFWLPMREVEVALGVEPGSLVVAGDHNGRPKH